MTAIIRTLSRTENAQNFITSFYSGTNNYLYCAISNWSGLSENDPPVDEKATDEALWTNLLGAVKINPADILPVIPKSSTTNWTSGTIYDVWDGENNVNPTVVGNNCVVLNQFGEVFLCVARVGSTVCTTEPVFYSVHGTATADSTYANDGTFSIITTQGGNYTWKFLYRLNPSTIANLDREDWLPVNFGVNRWAGTSDPEYTKSQDAVTISGTNGYAPKLLGAKNVIVRALFDSNIDDNITYRQTWLVKNPMLAGGVIQASGAFYAVPTDLEANTGTVLYVNNAKDVERIVNQSEEFKKVFSF